MVTKTFYQLVMDFPLAVLDVSEDRPGDIFEFNYIWESLLALYCGAQRHSVEDARVN